MSLLSKGDFARHIGVTPGRVSQMIAAGLIGADALEGDGRTAKVIVEKAVEQIKLRRDVGQATGNGLLTRLDAKPAADDGGGDADGLADSLDDADDVARLIQLQKLEEIERRNRIAAVGELRDIGRLVAVDDLRREAGRLAQDVMNVFLGMAPDIANAIAAKFNVSPRDALFEVRRVMAEKRADAATSRRDDAMAMPDTVDAEVDL